MQCQPCLYLPNTYITPSLAHWQGRSKYKGVSGGDGCERGWLGKKLARFFRDPILNFQGLFIFHAGNSLRHLKRPPPHTLIPKTAAGVVDTKRWHLDALHSPAIVQGKSAQMYSPAPTPHISLVSLLPTSPFLPLGKFCPCHCYFCKSKTFTEFGGCFAWLLCTS